MTFQRPIMFTLYQTPDYRVDSYRDGSLTITRHGDGVSLFTQGDDATTLRDELDATHDRWTVDDVCSQYDHVMS